MFPPKVAEPSDSNVNVSVNEPPAGLVQNDNSVPTLSVSAPALINPTVDVSELYQAISPLFPLVTDTVFCKYNKASAPAYLIPTSPVTVTPALVVSIFFTLLW